MLTSRPISPSQGLRLLSLALPVLCAALVVGCGGPRKPKDYTDEMAWADYHVADSGHPNWYRERADLRLKRGLLDGALDDCNTVLNTPAKAKLLSNSHRLIFLELRAVIQEQRKEYAASLADIDLIAALIDNDGSSPRLESYLTESFRGNLLVRLGRLSEAEAIAEALLKPGPGLPTFQKGINLMSQVYAAR